MLGSPNQPVGSWFWWHRRILPAATENKSPTLQEAGGFDFSPEISRNFL
jgi:hypothetical protein